MNLYQLIWRIILRTFLAGLLFLGPQQLKTAVDSAERLLDATNIEGILP